MNGRFPFDQHSARRQQQINAANGVRAALGLPANVLDAEAYYANLQRQNHQQNHQQLQLQRALQDVRLYSDLQQRQQQQQQQQQEQSDYALQQLLLAEQAIAVPYRQAYEQQLLRQLQRDTQQQQQQPVMALPSNPMMASNSLGASGLGYSGLGTSIMGAPAMGAPVMGVQGTPAMGASSKKAPSSMASPLIGSPGVDTATPAASPSTKPQATETTLLPAKRKSPPTKSTSPSRTKKSNRNHQQKPKRPKATTPVERPSPTEGPLDVLAGAAGLITQYDGIMSSISMVLKASEEVDDTDAIAGDLVTTFTKVTPEDLRSEEEDENTEELFIETPFFQSKAPEWPRTKVQHWFPKNRIDQEQTQPVEHSAGLLANDATPHFEDGTIDPWWPSVNAIKRERRNAGINMDEDDFVDSSKNETPFRVNEPEVRYRLANQVEPGVMEKLPHCRIHLLNSLQRFGAYPELAFCVQVTDLYPNDPILQCSSCGTWRHAKCGGRCTPSSGATNRFPRLNTICDLCYAETPYLEESPVGSERLGRQRMEHARRTLATSAVIRHFSNSKNAGTYKWPMGSVSAAHINGHIRSVHVRHEKAEKQWSDMTSRLARSLGFRARDRVKNRQREFERLLSALEDAEAFTDRHNMFLFLTRDTSKAVPAGFENEERNIFDPADDVKVADMSSSLNDGNKIGCGNCEREGCPKQQRFDSRFCSDACGVACLEMDLLRSLEDAGEVHPSFLRTVV